MTGPKPGGDVGIVAAALVDIVDVQRDRRAGGDLAAEPLARAIILEHAGQDAHRIRLLALGDELALPRPALVEPDLDVGLRQSKSGGATVDHAADRRPVALTPGRDAEQVAERVVRHGR